jgi:HlyD family secretion protein
LFALIALALLAAAGCGGGESPAAEEAETSADSATPAATATSQPTPAIVIPDPADTEMIEGVFATGYVRAAQDADLVFQVSGEVERVLVEEGDMVQKDEVLAVLDTRRFDQDVRNAEAALISARADQLALVEDPTEERLRAAEAQVSQAAGNLNQVQGRVTAEDLAAARASIEEARAALADLEDGADALDVQQAQTRVEQARANLDMQRTRLSQAKTQAEINVQQAADNVRSAQVRYSAAYWDWRYVRDHGSAPPRTEREPTPNLSAQGEQDFRNQLEQAEIDLESAEERLESARKSLEEAIENEKSGVQQAESQLQEAQLSLEQVLEPAEADQFAAARARVANAEANLARLQGLQRAGEIEAAQAALNAAEANRDQLFSDPTESQSIRAEANISRAEANLEQSRLNREYAELQAPFAGEVAAVNIDPGDPAITAGAGGTPAIRLVDLSQLYVEVDVPDADIAQVEKGQTARVVADAIRGEMFEGTVSFVSPAANTSAQGVTTYMVRIELDDVTESGATLRAGMSVSVTIETDSAASPDEDE